MSKIKRKMENVENFEAPIVGNIYHRWHCNIRY